MRRRRMRYCPCPPDDLAASHALVCRAVRHPLIRTRHPGQRADRRAPLVAVPPPGPRHHAEVVLVGRSSRSVSASSYCDQRATLEPRSGR